MLKQENIRHLGFLSGATLERQLGPSSIVVIPTVMEENAGLAALEQTMGGAVIVSSIVDALGTKARDRALQLFRRRRMIEGHARLYKRIGLPKQELMLHATTKNDLWDPLSCLALAS